jgi:hypothetical protein
MKKSPKGHAKAKAKSKHKTKSVRRGRKEKAMDVLLVIFTALTIISGAILSFLGIAGGLKNHRSLGLWMLFATIVFALVWAFLYIQKQMWEGEKAVIKPSPDLHGLLIPANDPRPKIPESCRAPDHAVIVLGSCAFMTDKDWAGVLDIYGQQILTMRKEPGGIAISARLISSVNKAFIAQITNNEFYVNPSNEFTLSRDDWNSLRVTDSAKNTVLYVRFLNPNTIKVLGSFYVNNASPIIITEQGVKIGGGMMSDTCFSAARKREGAAIGITGPDEK